MDFWTVGVDWGRREHALCLMDGLGHVQEEFISPCDTRSLVQLCERLRSHAQEAELRIAIERPDGLLVSTLLEQGFEVYSINPKQLSRFRDRHSMSGAKDDRRDARVLADSLRTDRRAFRKLQRRDDAIIELSSYTRVRDELTQERVRLTNRFRDELYEYYPQFLELGGELSDRFLLKLWKRIPDAQAAARVRKTTVSKLLKSHRIRRIDAEKVLETLRCEPAQVSQGTVVAACAHISQLVERLELLNRQLRDVEASIDRVLAQMCEPTKADEQRDATILRSLPGVGRIVLATLLSEASEALEERDYQKLRAMSGIAPVTKRSGKSLRVTMRRGCSPRLREAMYHWSRVAVQNDELMKAKYTALRQRGHSHARALRTVADRCLKIACTLLQRGMLFDPDYKPSRMLEQQPA